MIKFSVPDYVLDKTTIEEAAKRNGIIIVPKNCSADVIDYLQGQINELGYTHSDGSAIPIVSWEVYLKNKETYANFIPVFHLYEDIFVEVFDYHWTDAVVLVDHNDF